MLIKNNKLLISFLLLVIIPTIYKLGTMLLSYLNLVFRDWVIFLFTFIILSSFIFFLIQLLIFLKIKISNSKSLKKPIKIFINVVLIVVATTLIFGALAIGGLVSLFTFEEIGVEVHNSKKYIVRQEGFLDPFYSYYEYKNIFLRGKEIKYSGEWKWGEGSKQEDYTLNNSHIKDSHKNTENEHLDKEVTLNENKDEDNSNQSIENMNVPSSEVEFVYEADSKTKYGLYIVDAAIGSRIYAFVNSVDKGVTWKARYLFPVGREVYKMKFLDEDTGFVNIDAENLNIYMTKDRGKTWENLNINLPESKKDYKFLNDVEKIDEKIVITLGYPHWTGAAENIKYYTEDQGKTWNLEGEKK